MYSVYAKVTEEGYVRLLFSNFLQEPEEGDVLIDTGDTDRHQFPISDVIDNRGRYKYRIKDGKIVRTNLQRMFEIEKITKEINKYKRLLSELDYKTMKYIEGRIQLEEFEGICCLKDGYRMEINSLEEKLKELEDAERKGE